MLRARGRGDRAGLRAVVVHASQRAEIPHPAVGRGQHDARDRQGDQHLHEREAVLPGDPGGRPGPSATRASRRVPAGSRIVVAPARRSKRYERERPDVVALEIEREYGGRHLGRRATSKPPGRPARASPPARAAEAGHAHDGDAIELRLVTKDPAGSPSSPASTKWPSSVPSPCVRVREHGGDEVRGAGPHVRQPAPAAPRRRTGDSAGGRPQQASARSAAIAPSACWPARETAVTHAVTAVTVRAATPPAMTTSSSEKPAAGRPARAPRSRPRCTATSPASHTPRQLDDHGVRRAVDVEVAGPGARGSGEAGPPARAELEARRGTCSGRRRRDCPLITWRPTPRARRSPRRRRPRP